MYEEVLDYEPDSSISSVGALIVSSYEKIRRSPKDKSIIEYPSIIKDVWRVNINIGMDEATFMISRGSVIVYLNTQQRIYVVDGYAGWYPKYRIKVLIVAKLPYYALFKHNMLIRPNAKKLVDYGE